MQFIKFDELLRMLFHVGIHNFLNIDVPTLLSGKGDLGECFTYGGKTDSVSGGTLEVKPYYNLLVGRFTATNTFSGFGDTCIITDYQPNTETPEQGGTFTLGGF
ncbi:hypothetical protein [Okeania sp. KiyG1]|uniref:hypothetical protein n=1 Tax=Okeania sp. KiyG1 TaxID=2720165 RepID=UPI001923CF8E|nr:hypothetical protein [Okeania sp. KiyG1]GGA56014.1 hypothetical protein CYANOKiyG1_76770 [Okeania sp. KiyG1]